MSKLNITDEQKIEIAEVCASHWGGHFQAGYTKHPPTDEPQILSLWVKMGPHYQARNYEIHPDGTVIVKNVEWDGRSPQ